MSAPAVALMVITILLVWGGLVASIVALHALPVPDEEPDESGEASPSASHSGS